MLTLTLNPHTLHFHLTTTGCQPRITPQFLSPSHWSSFHLRKSAQCYCVSDLRHGFTIWCSSTLSCSVYKKYVFINEKAGESLQNKTTNQHSNVFPPVASLKVPSQVQTSHCCLKSRTYQHHLWHWYKLVLSSDYSRQVIQPSQNHLTFIYLCKYSTSLGIL